MPRPFALPVWSVAAPLVGWLLLCALWLLDGLGGLFTALLVAGLLGCVMAAVHHAEVIAHRVGEPYGTLILAVAVTIIEVALIVSLMLKGGPAATALARDTVFAALMIILNGMVGLCMLAGGSRFGEQRFGLYGVSASLTTLAAIAVLTLVLPNYTTTVSGPFYSVGQLGFIAVVSLVLYGTFVLVQAVRHRDYFLPEASKADADAHAQPPSTQVTLVSLALLLGLPGSSRATGQVACADDHCCCTWGGRAAGGGRHHHCRCGAVARGSGGLSGGPGQSPADQPQPGTGLGAGQHWPDHSGRRHCLHQHGLDLDAGAGRQVHHLAAAVIVCCHAVPGHGPYHGLAGRGSSGHFCDLPVHDAVSVTRF